LNTDKKRSGVSKFSLLLHVSIVLQQILILFRAHQKYVKKSIDNAHGKLSSCSGFQRKQIKLSDESL